MSVKPDDRLHERVIDELARVLWEEERATTFVLRIGFPPESMPRFKSPSVFWTLVVLDAMNGRLTGGVETLLDEAMNQYPGNNVLAMLRAEMAMRIGHGMRQANDPTQESNRVHHQRETKQIALLNDNFSLSIREHMAKLNRRVEKLTADQLRVVRQLRALRRVRVSGCAGSGKTLVAAEKAIRLAEGGLSTLFICHSPILARHVQHLTQGSGVYVRAFGAWIADLSGMDAQFRSGVFVSYQEPTPVALDQAFDRIIEGACSYDAIVVDEGQDFRNEWWDLVEAALSESGAGVLYIFHDDHQALLPYRSNYPIRDAMVDLSRNCRNSGKIYDLMRSVHPGAAEPEDQLRDLGDTLLIPYQRNECNEAIERALRWLHHDDAKASLTALIRNGSDFSQSALSYRAFLVDNAFGWQQEVRRRLERAITAYDVRGVKVPVGGAEAIFSRLAHLSTSMQPTSDDVALVRDVARLFSVDRNLRRRILDNPKFRNAMTWSIRDGRLELRRPMSAPLWSAEVIMHFERADWHIGIPYPRAVSFAPHHRARTCDIPVYDVGQFKGLESDRVLFLVEGSAPITEHELYVGFSRARLLLAVLVDISNVGMLPTSVRSQL